MDGRKNNKGTKGNKGGRPPKAVEMKAYERGLEAIIEKYGSESKYWAMIAEQALESFPHLKLLTEYTYGKAPEKIDITGGNITIKPPSWFNE